MPNQNVGLSWQAIMTLFTQFLHFIGISGAGWLIDFSLFNLLHFALESVAVCNLVSSLAAVSFVFALSVRKTFAQKQGGIPLRIKFAVYATYQIVLISAMSLLISAIDARLSALLTPSPAAPLSSALAKIAATPVTMTLNFFVMKFLIERL